MLVVRFSDNIQKDIKRNWSTFMTPNLGGTKEDLLQDIEDGHANGEIREFPEHPGCFGIVHHEGLSCYALESEDLDDAEQEVFLNLDSFDGSGFAERTIGEVVVLRKISKHSTCTTRDCYILEVEDYTSES